MQKSSRILLALGSIVSLSTIPLIAARCDNRKNLKDFITTLELKEIKTQGGQKLNSEKIIEVFKNKNQKTKDFKKLSAIDITDENAKIFSGEHLGDVIVNFSLVREKLSEFFDKRNLGEIVTFGGKTPTKEQLIKLINKNNPKAKNLLFDVEDITNNKAKITSKSYDDKVEINFNVVKEKLSDIIKVTNLKEIKYLLGDRPTKKQVLEKIIKENPNAECLALDLEIGEIKKDAEDNNKFSAKIASKKYEIKDFKVEFISSKFKLNEIAPVTDLGEIKTSEKSGLPSYLEIINKLVEKNPELKKLKETKMLNLEADLEVKDITKEEATVISSEFNSRIQVTYAPIKQKLLDVIEVTDLGEIKYLTGEQPTKEEIFVALVAKNPEAKKFEQEIDIKEITSTTAIVSSSKHDDSVEIKFVSSIKTLKEIVNIPFVDLRGSEINKSNDELLKKAILDDINKKYSETKNLSISVELIRQENSAKLISPQNGELKILFLID